MKVALALMLGLLGACASDSGVATQNDSPTRGSIYSSRCNLVRDLVRAPIAAGNVRSVQFLPFGISTESVDFYAPMKGEPFDDVTQDFYGRRMGQGIGQFTHYLRSPDLGDVLGNCLDRGAGFLRRSRAFQEDSYAAVFFDADTRRSIVILAGRDTVGMLIADRRWRGDPKAKLAELMELSLN